ncbi:TetR/AcrR family transcriptional regulator [Halobacillus salinarum]|uniref:TetR/AcrR family transcriptional regulator n=1 Tax=Halobacillus salinarum TaxID=2932257 RepID=A0ABY4EP60_9BACI|nr:TetR/AcrR family transcriptional regulator C-terminal domain-containing protein [Halobacillus salinarum]UOQ45770.1 TetR/AcrR family transcriptional regulator [Halobacillus salinarum]
MSTIDRRKLKSQKAIQSAFLAMVIDIGFDEITVKDVAEKADLGRKTFYLHYVDKYDLLDHIVDGHLEELTKICKYKETVDFFEGSVIWFEYFEEHRAFFAALFKSHSTLSFRRKLLDFVINDLKKKLDPDSPLNEQIDQDMILKFLGMAVVGVMESYVLEELAGDTKTVAMQVGQLVKRNL